MKLDDVPFLKGEFPARISVAVSEETKRVLGIIKRKKKKDPSALVRMLIDEFLKENPIDEAS